MIIDKDLIRKTTAEYTARRLDEIRKAQEQQRIQLEEKQRQHAQEVLDNAQKNCMKSAEVGHTYSLIMFLRKREDYIIDNPRKRSDLTGAAKIVYEALDKENIEWAIHKEKPSGMFSVRDDDEYNFDCYISIFW